VDFVEIYFNYIFLLQTYKTIFGMNYFLQFMINV